MGDIRPPQSSGYVISFLPAARAGTSDKLVIKTPFSTENKEICSRIPDRRVWDGSRRAWVTILSRPVVEYLKKNFPQAEWTPEAEGAIANLDKDRLLKEQTKASIPAVYDYPYGGKFQPFKHQENAFSLARHAKAFALLMEQGTGKSRVVVDVASYNYLQGEINGVLVVCPNSVKTNWVTEEITTHTPDMVKPRAFYYESSRAERILAEIREVPKGQLVWLVINVEALSSEKGTKTALEFLKMFETLMVVDESSRIKNPQAKRTKNVIALGRLARRRLILSGTPVTQGPLDLFPQFKFLDPTILGYGSYYAFRNEFAVIGGWNGKEIIGYQNLDKLSSLIQPYSYRVTKAECLDLPEKIYQKLIIELAPEQRKLYDQMKKNMIAELSETNKVSVTIALTQLLRLQQIVGGFLPQMDDEGKVTGEAQAIPGPNPKLDTLLDTLDQISGKAIIWARFRPEIRIIAAALRKAYGNESVVEFHGGVSDDARIVARQSFQDPQSPVRWFVGQTETGGLGLTLTQAKTVIYFSNSFSLESRLQSEDRAHRIGQTEHVTYLDMVAKDTLDEKLVHVLRSKRQLADLITQDNIRDWL
jgi:SNF2 family DNA or RNA helicase